MTETLILAFDLLLALALVVTAWLAVDGRGPGRAVVLYIIFGFLMVLVWMRLDAPDLALAEAALGTGVTAVLLIELLARLRVNDRE